MSQQADAQERPLHSPVDTSVHGVAAPAHLHTGLCDISERLAFFDRQRQDTNGPVMLIDTPAEGWSEALEAAGVHGPFQELLTSDLPSSAPHMHGDSVNEPEDLLAASWQAALSGDHSAAAAPSESRCRLAAISLDLLDDEQVLPALTWVAGCLAPLGFVAVWSTSPLRHLAQLQPSLVDVGLLQAVEPECVDPLGPLFLAVLQRRGTSESRATGVVRSVTWDELEANSELADGLVATYREAFGGDEWQEWVCCARVECRRGFSLGHVAQLGLTDHCPCDWKAPLQVCHTGESILAKARADLADEDRSCCFLRADDGASVQGFIWGYLTDLDGLVRTLGNNQPDDVVSELRSQLAAFLRDSGNFKLSTPFYFNSELGVASSMRRPGLARMLFQRILQFAADSEVPVIVVRSSRRAHSYPLLLGAGLRVVMEYEEQPARGIPQRAPWALLGGDVRQLLLGSYTQTDRRMAVHMAHQLRQQRREGWSHATPLS